MFNAIWTLVSRTFWQFFLDNCFQMAAALAFYTIFTLPPLLVMAMSVAGAVFGDAVARGEINEQVQYLVGSEGARQVNTLIENAQRPALGFSITTFTGIIAFLIGVTGAFVQLQYSLNRVWEVQPSPNSSAYWDLVKKRFMSFGMVLVIVFLLLVSLVVSALLTAFGKYLGYIMPSENYAGLIRWANIGVSYVVIAFLFGLIYKVMPDATVAWKDVIVGAVVTAVLFAIGKYLIGLYLGNTDLFSVYGAAGSFALVLVWVYYASLILFLGAEFTQVYASLFGSTIRPSPGAVKVVEVLREEGPYARVDEPKEEIEQHEEEARRKKAEMEAETFEEDQQ
jgi:membrane protein